VSDLDDLARALADFAAAREWEQFHTPKNLSMALAGEAGELLAELQWLTEPEIAAGLAHDADLRARVADEVADVLLYTVRFAAVCGIDPLAEAYAKIERNETRYPADRARGSAAKHTAY
jgi:dCTP diphosphatase